MNIEEDVQKAIQGSILDVLSKLYVRICNCRARYEELDQLLNPKFHLDDCPYEKACVALEVKFEDE